MNTCLNALRAEKCRPELRLADLNDEEADVVEKVIAMERSPNPAEQLAARDLAHKMLQTLSARDRLIISLLDLEERSVEEVRELTGWNVSVIKVRAFRARTKLRKQFGRIMKEHHP